METVRSANCKGHRALRRGRVSLPGQIYFVTFATHDRDCLFSNFPVAHAVSAAIEDRRLWDASKLLAWVLMPDHWHGAIQLGDMHSLSAVVQALKTNTARRARAAQPEIDRVWATAFHDRALRQEEDLHAVARYMVLNPVRAGLVKRIRDYPYWNAVWL